MRVPLATYRLQLARHLTFEDAAALLDYLQALGVSDVYTSPFFETSSQRSHGYDVNDHNTIRAEIGGERGLRVFAEALRARDMGLLIDLVPNHMGIAGNRNARWLEVLQEGPAAAAATYFDIDWAPVKAELTGKVLLPILGDQYGTVLDAGQLRLTLRDGGFRVEYYDTVLPLAPRTWARILGHGLGTLQAALGAEHPDLVELKSLITWFTTIPPRHDADPAVAAGHRRQVETGRKRLAGLLAQAPAVREFLEANVRAFNGTPGDPRSFDALDALLDEQAYRVAFWRVAGEEINYRRFFDINELAAIRMEEPDVFAEAHRLVFRLVGEGIVTGLRVDHPDGLYAPAEYFRRLQRGCAQARGREDGDFYVVAEKILAPGEHLPEGWPTAGTTGYEFLNLVNGLFVDRAQARAMEHIYARVIRVRPPFSDVVNECKRLIMETSMASELNMLGHRLNRLSEKHRSSRDFTLGSLTTALREIIAAFPVYRTYVGDDSTESPPDRRAPEASAGAPTAHITDRDRDYIARAVAHARRRTPTMNASIYDWIQGVLTLRFPDWATEADRAERVDFVRRFQQLTGPVTAKGYEDTVLYRFNRLVSLNEVGGDPSRFGTAPAEFHAENAERRRRSPHALSASATHDTKRGEDVRARINVLSEIPGEWRARVAAWQRLNRKHRTMLEGAAAPGANTEYLLYQTLVGAWPLDAERLRAYMVKATREAKVHTSWINPDPRYDGAIAKFVEAILDPERAAAFLADFLPFQARVAHFGRLNSLAQTLVKLTAPGVPDFYQGTELWDLSLVDPDNRRPVDWAPRRRMLDELRAALAGGAERAALARELAAGMEDGRVKLFLVHEALAFRRARRALFERGDYRPLEARGVWAEHVCAFARVADGAAAVTVIPRLLARRGAETPPLGDGYWADTTVELPPELGGRLRNALTGERVETRAAGAAAVLPLGAALASFPVALLETP
ncbi:MAG TPA: malto-oligosyltrehalose synthase [Methylomirabilota bacterium]|nr:malto-oligosyltrehalose synthase [Methylomirabilota bacterium]